MNLCGIDSRCAKQAVSGEQTGQGPARNEGARRILTMVSNQKPRRDNSDGEVVYRRVPLDQESGSKSKEPRLDPTLMPLLVGCALLILFVFVLGNLSERRVEETSREVLELEQQHLARATLLLQVRMALMRLDTEARNRMTAEARQEFRPPFDLRLSTARNDLANLMPLLDRAPIDELPKWRAFRDDLQTYLAITRSAADYSLQGFDTFQRVDRELNDVFQESSLEQEQIFQRSNAMQVAAAHSIRIWTLIAILAGLFVTAGTIWEVQRRFRQTRQSVEEARREREFSNQMMQGMVSAIAAIDRHDRIRSANATFFQLFPKASVGASIHDKVGAPDAVRVLEAATASHVTRATYRGRWNLGEHETAGTYDVYSSPLEIDNEHGQLLTLVDVTEATAAEAALRRSEALAAVGQAAAQLAHEIKNPLGSIRLGVAMLRDGAADGDALKTIALVERGIAHLNKLVMDVTQFSRQRPLERVEVDLHELIDSSIELVADRIQEKQARIERNYSGEGIHGYWDEDQLREVILNLVANAIDASDERGRVSISTELIAKDVARSGVLNDEISTKEGASANRVRVVIRDSGSGIDATTRAHIFEPFFTTKKRGTGLGLAIVKQIVEAHEGTISVESESGKGTSFTVELPLSSSRPAA
jgi:signal transduction histidine kinase